MAKRKVDITRVVIHLPLLPDSLIGLENFPDLSSLPYMESFEIRYKLIRDFFSIIKRSKVFVELMRRCTLVLSPNTLEMTMYRNDISEFMDWVIYLLKVKYGNNYTYIPEEAVGGTEFTIKRYI